MYYGDTEGRYEVLVRMSELQAACSPTSTVQEACAPTTTQQVQRMFNRTPLTHNQSAILDLYSKIKDSQSISSGKHSSSKSAPVKPYSMQVDKLVPKSSNRMLSPCISPATSPTLTHSGSPTPPLYQTQHKVIAGIPTVAAASRYTAPVHIDVGGAIYTSSLETLTRFPDSRLARLFNGSIPIVLDSLKQHYFIDRDGKMFRHVLNYMRHGRLLLPEDFTDFDLLIEEAKFFELGGLIKQVDELKKSKMDNIGGDRDRGLENTSSSNGSLTSNSRLKHIINGIKTEDDTHGYDVIAVNVSPDLVERVMLSGDRGVIEELFPEVAQAMMDSRSSLAWNHDPKFIIRFPLNGYCKLNSMQAIQRLLNASFQIVASTGGGFEVQQFSEYLFCRKSVPL